MKFIHCSTIAANQRWQLFAAQCGRAGKLQGGNPAGDAERDCESETGNHRSYQIGIQPEVKDGLWCVGEPLYAAAATRLDSSKIVIIVSSRFYESRHVGGEYLLADSCMWGRTPINACAGGCGFTPSSFFFFSFLVSRETGMLGRFLYEEKRWNVRCIMRTRPSGAAMDGFCFVIS